MFISAFVVSILLLVGPAAAAVEHHAAARVRINRPFFLRAGKVTKHIIDRLAPDITIPPINATIFNYFSFHTSEIEVTEFDFPRTKYSISERGLDFNSAGGSVTLTLAFVFKFPPFMKLGVANVTFSDLRTNVSAIVTTKQSRPHFNATFCDAMLGRGFIETDDFNNDALSSAMKDYIIKYIRNGLKHNMCLFITTASDLANEFVEFQSEDIRLYRNIYLNYTADADPVFRDDYLEAKCTFRADLIGQYSDPEDSIGHSEADVWFLVLYLTWRIWWSLKNRRIRMPAEIAPLVNKNVVVEQFADSYQRID